VFEERPLWLREKPLGLSEKPFRLHQKPFGLSLKPCRLHQKPFGLSLKPCRLRQKPFGLSLSKPLRALRQAQCERGCGPVMHRLLVSMHTVARADWCDNPCLMICGHARAAYPAAILRVR
jgi:hypothetical protein